MIKLLLIVLCLTFFTDLSHAFYKGSVAAPKKAYIPSYPPDGGKLDKRALLVQYYKDVDGADHQQRFNHWTAAGYVLISISVYDTPPNVKYAAVWVQRSTPSFVAIHGVDATTFQNWFNQQKALGYVATLVSATGPRNGAVYMAVMQKLSIPSWTQSCDMTADGFQTASNNAYSNRQILKVSREYGTPTDRRYCAIWHANPNFDKWNWYYSQPYTDYQTTFNIEVSKPYWRVVYASVSEDQRISSVYQDTNLGDWHAVHGLTSAEVDGQVATQANLGRSLISLQGGGAGTGARFVLIFAAQDVPEVRSWTTEGSSTGFRDPTGASAAIESTMKSFMQNSGVRQAQVAAYKNGQPLMAFSYTWAEPSRYHTHVSDKFLLASVSKMFCAAAIQTLLDKQSITPSTKVYPRLGYGSNPPDRRVNDITVQQLIDHYGGFDSGASGFDAVFRMRDIAVAQNGGSGPASVKDIVDYMFSRPLDFTPGAKYVYSNFGYVLLSRLVEVVSGIAYYDYLQAKVLGTDYAVSLWATAPAAHRSDTIIQESAGYGLSALNVRSTIPEANIYGGDGIYKESDAGGASLAASAQTVARFINTHAVWGRGGRAPGSAREGSMEGAQAWASSRADGVDWAVVVNTRQWPPNQNPTFDTLVNTNIPAFFDTHPTS